MLVNTASPPWTANIGGFPFADTRFALRLVSHTTTAVDSSYYCGVESVTSCRVVSCRVDTHKPVDGVSPTMIANLAQGVQAFTSNAYLVTGERTVLIDAGANFDIAAAIRDRVDGLDAVVLTHTHRDHIGNLEAVTEAFDVDVWGYDTSIDGVGRAIEDEETVQLGDHEYVALHTPGHKDDHLCFYSPDAGVLFAGDLVFQNGSFGRTDLEEGDRQTLIESIDRVLERIDEDLEEMHTGHGPSVSRNPYDHVELSSQMARRA